MIIKITITSSQIVQIFFCLVKKGRVLFSLFCFILLTSANLRNYTEKTWEKLSLYFKSNKILVDFSTWVQTKVQFTNVYCKFLDTLFVGMLIWKIFLIIFMHDFQNPKSAQLGVTKNAFLKKRPHILKANKNEHLKYIYKKWTVVKKCKRGWVTSRCFYHSHLRFFIYKINRPHKLVMTTDPKNRLTEDYI